MTYCEHNNCAGAATHQITRRGGGIEFLCSKHFMTSTIYPEDGVKAIAKPHNSVFTEAQETRIRELIFEVLKDSLVSEDDPPTLPRGNDGT